MTISRITIVFMMSSFLYSESKTVNMTNVLKDISEGKIDGNFTRRIMKGNPAGSTRPYMVYLRPVFDRESKIVNDYKDWICGGVIIHELYVLTSAACIEDVDQFFVISGTSVWTAIDDTNDCITNGGKRAVWKCVPKNYTMDAQDYDNIRWIINDLAIVKVEDEFNFEKRVRGCEYIPQPIAYNNISDEYERPGSDGEILGWGSTGKYPDQTLQKYFFARKQENEDNHENAKNSPTLLETEVFIISKKNCRQGWPERYHYIINGNVVCTAEVHGTSVCTEQQVNCKDLVAEDYNEEGSGRRFMLPVPGNSSVHTSAHHSFRRMRPAGGFCKNDHGGPLIVGQGKSAVVVGVISACQLSNDRRCHGPFLFTSVWANRNVINCAINKELLPYCRKMMKDGQTDMKETTYDWSSYRFRKKKPTYD